MLMRIWLFGIALALVSCELTGDHICEEEERYPVNITEFSLRNVTVRNYKWCMGFPPRCSFYTLKTVKVPEVVERLETRLVRKCCPGFAENVNRDGCVPCKKCFEGSCGIGGNCLCNSGFRGEDCADACESMRWGVNCQQECLCEHGNCNPRTGRCDCPTGWFGTRCEVPCLEGFYGKHCINRCSCGERDLCSPETGDCLRKKTRQQEHQSTRAIQYMTEDVFNITIPINKQKSTPSLQKYYTFDMELNNNNTADENEIIDELNIKRQNPKINNKVTASSERRRPTRKQYKSTTQAMSKNNNADKKYGNTLGSVEDSAESTTEMSSEIARNIENVAIIDENGSLEYNKKINTLDKSQEIIHDSFGLSGRKRNKTEYKEKTNHTFNNNGKSRNESTAYRKSEPRKHDSNEKGHVDVTRIQKILDAELYENLTTVYPNNPVRNHSDYSTNVEGFNRNSETTSSVDTFRPVDVTLHRVEDIIPPTSIKPASITTPSSKGDGTSDHAIALEENELQNLDVINNILTSRETTTPSRPFFTTIGQNNALKKEILSFGDFVPSTKSIDMKNDLYPPESTENQISMKETYERRNGNEPIGGVSEEYEYSTNNNSNITTHMSIVALVSLISVLILSGVILVHHYSRKRKTKKIDNQNYTGPTVSVYTHSIFHTPLPDPPIFENPVFKTPSEVSNDHRTIQTHVICSLNFPENKICDEKEYTYDHPPSTGSYRAASIPEPPEILETLNSEPVYDEIPSSRRGNQTMSPPPSYKSSCLYMNTCGKTRF